MRRARLHLPLVVPTGRRRSPASGSGISLGPGRALGRGAGGTIHKRNRPSRDGLLELPSIMHHLCPTGQLLQSSRYCCTTVLPANVTAVCANSLPFTDAPVCSVIDVCDSTSPSRCAVVPISMTPKTCQKTF
jgi:hypothetical protein